MSSHKHLVWAVAACAAIVAQAVPKYSCQGCERPCCSARAESPAAAVDSGFESDGECPLCAAAIARPAGSDMRPCRCQLDARHDQPLSTPRHTLKASADVRPVIAPSVATPAVPPVIGVSREYVAASLTVPIRPPRILFCIWRE